MSAHLDISDQWSLYFILISTQGWGPQPNHYLFRPPIHRNSMDLPTWGNDGFCDENIDHHLKDHRESKVGHNQQCFFHPNPPTPRPSHLIRAHWVPPVDKAPHVCTQFLPNIPDTLWFGWLVPSSPYTQPFKIVEVVWSAHVQLLEKRATILFPSISVSSKSDFDGNHIHRWTNLVHW